jgi:hypothetical protein
MANLHLSTNASYQPCLKRAPELCHLKCPSAVHPPSILHRESKAIVFDHYTWEVWPSHFSLFAENLNPSRSGHCINSLASRFYFYSQVCGWPLSSEEWFSPGLLWFHRTSIRPELYFPSSSWVGWIGEVSGNLVFDNGRLSFRNDNKV